ncbi:uncharacterized protein YcfL [Dysgonomonas sp. PH5-45]|uniref:hypothetical protein n=1 Tax=unclassified Dysgonomonas TaxID=2630389 RepID=UPI002476ADA9|nr:MULTISPECIES: hypothetical protein [unclassified Dysgonomonas]MDH6355784.1 uncharacterized protein YcfL [Dysgonomonas sp. PH5-45]MDH6388681.1 uncharacterized protein YcfL [Dysgonomonas sp. PH5-37]
MKSIIFILLLASFLFTACKSSEKCACPHPISNNVDIENNNNTYEEQQQLNESLS